MQIYLVFRLLFIEFERRYNIGKPVSTIIPYGIVVVCKATFFETAMNGWDPTKPRIQVSWDRFNNFRNYYIWTKNRMCLGTTKRFRETVLQLLHWLF